MRKWKLIRAAYWAAAFALPLPLGVAYDRIREYKQISFNMVPSYVFGMCLYVGTGMFLGLYRILSLAGRTGRWRFRWGFVLLAIPLLAVAVSASAGPVVLLGWMPYRIWTYLYQLWFLYALLSGFCLALALDKRPPAPAEAEPGPGAQIAYTPAADAGSEAEERL